MLKVQQREFSQVLKRVVKASSGPSIMEIYYTILFKYLPGEEKLLVTHTDTELGMQLKVPAEVEGDAEVLVPLQVVEVVSHIPDGPMCVRVKDSDDPKGQGIVVEALNHDIRYDLPYIADVSNFPELPEPEDPVEIQVPAARFHDALKKVEPSIAQDTGRPYLNGVYLETQTEKDKLYLTATDTRRLSHMEITAEGLDLEEDHQWIVPTEAVKLLLSELKEAGEDDRLTAVFGKNHLRFSLEDMMIHSRIIGAEYPNWRQFFPEKERNQVSVDRDALVKAVRRMKVLSDTVVLETTADLSQLCISVPQGEKGYAEEKLTTICDESMKLLADAKYLRDAIAPYPEDGVQLDVGGALDPIVIPELDGYSAILMPKRPD